MTTHRNHKNKQTITKNIGPMAQVAQAGPDVPNLRNDCQTCRNGPSDCGNLDPNAEIRPQMRKVALQMRKFALQMR